MPKVGAIKTNEQTMLVLLLVGGLAVLAAKKAITATAEIIDENVIDPIAGFLAAPSLHYWEQVQFEVEKDRDFARAKLAESIRKAKARGEDIPQNILDRAGDTWNGIYGP